MFVAVESTHSFLGIPMLDRAFAKRVPVNQRNLNHLLRRRAGECAALESLGQ